MFCRKLVAVFGLVAALSRFAIASTSLTEDFSSDPFAVWSFGIGSNNLGQFTWNSASSPVYTGDVTGSLAVHLDSSRPTVRFQRPLGVTVTDTDDFTLITRFSLDFVHGADDQFAQIAFGLVNTSLTGGDRTGTQDTNFNFLATDNTFHTCEFNYFPNFSTFFDTGPTLTPVVFGAQTATNVDAFANFASIFGSDSDLHDNTNGVTSLPTNVTLQATLAYSGATKTLALTMSRVNFDGTLTPIDTGVPPLDIVASGYSTNFPFRVDALAIMAYHDGFTTTNDPSLIADVQFQKIDFTTTATAPQPPSFVSISISSANVVLTFPTISNAAYYVQSRTNLASGSWSTIASNIVGTGGILTNIDVGAAAVPAKFYRIGLIVP
jgi:hypothetical protein